MSRLSELTSYRNIIISKLISNDNIIKAVGNNESNFLGVESKDPSSLIYSNIFPYYYALSSLNQTNQEQKTFITMMFKNLRLENRIFKVSSICFYVFTHFLLMPTDYGSLRTDYILNQIDQTFNQTKELGIGELQFEKLDDMPFSPYHFGSAITYKDFSFN